MEDMWMAEIESVMERLDLGPDHYYGLSKDAAINCLVRLGLNRDEAETMIGEAMA